MFLFGKRSRRFNTNVEFYNVFPLLHFFFSSPNCGKPRSRLFFFGCPRIRAVSLSFPMSLLSDLANQSLSFESANMEKALKMAFLIPSDLRVMISARWRWEMLNFSDQLGTGLNTHTVTHCTLHVKKVAQNIIN